MAASAAEVANTVLVTNDAVVLGLLAATLGFVFWSSNRTDGFWKRFYGVVPALLMCYLIPAVLNSFGVIDGSASGLYPMARDYLLPGALVLFCLSMDLGAILRLGPKAIIVFLAGTVGVMLGAVVSFIVIGWIHPETVAGDTWRGMATLAGSWIGGGANQAAMKEVFQVDATLFGQFVAVDVVVGNLWMAGLLLFAGKSAAFDRWMRADTSAIEAVQKRMENYHAEHARIPSLSDLMLIIAIALGITGLSHFLSAPLVSWIGSLPAEWNLKAYSLTSGFFWLVVLATTFGVLLSFSRARQLEGAGASKIGSVMLYFLVATIGMQMDLSALLERPWLFALGAIWMMVHAAVLFGVAWMVRAPAFFIAVGSQANIGAAASAPVVASAFHPSLAPVGVLLAVLGYALGTYCAYIVGIVLQMMAAG
jgi:uncharacterized membrane protein